MKNLFYLEEEEPKDEPVEEGDKDENPMPKPPPIK